MATSIYRQPSFQQKPPDKGSFPLDHDGTCKEAMIEYMKCLRNCDMDNTKCREQSKAYLKCRMDNNLMAKEEWKSLGFPSNQSEPQSSNSK